jgi:predicted lactoylglutathione lyase
MDYKKHILPLFYKSMGTKQIDKPKQKWRHTIVIIEYLHVILLRKKMFIDLLSAQGKRNMNKISQQVNPP